MDAVAGLTVGTLVACAVVTCLLVGPAPADLPAVQPVGQIEERVVQQRKRSCRPMSWVRQ